MFADGIIFDLDGTLWDSTPSIYKAWQTLLSQYPNVVPPLSLPELQSLMGLPASELTATLFPNVPVETQRIVLKACNDAQISILAAEGGTLYPGLVETLTELKKNHRLYIVSNCQSSYLEAFFSGHGLRNLFEDCLCFGHNGRSKGENISEIIRRHSLNSAVYVGDTQSDHQGAMDAGIPFVFAEYGFGNVEHYDAKLSTLGDLRSIISKGEITHAR